MGYLKEQRKIGKTWIGQSRLPWQDKELEI